MWAAPPESPTCLGRIRGRGWGRDRGSHRSQAIPSSRGGKPGGAWAGPRSSGQSRSAAVGHSLPSPSLSPSAALKPQISARQRLERAEIRSGRACGRAQGAVAGMGSGVRCGGTRAPGSLHCPSHAGGSGGAGAEPGAEVSEGLREGLTLTAKGHSAPGRAGDNGARLLQPTSSPALADPQEKPLSPLQVMPKPRRRPWPGAVLGHPSCCSSPCSCSSSWAVSAVHPVLSHPQHPEPSRLAGAGRNSRARAGWGLARAGDLPNARLFLSTDGGPL